MGSVRAEVDLQDNRQMYVGGTMSCANVGSIDIPKSMTPPGTASSCGELSAPIHRLAACFRPGRRPLPYLSWPSHTCSVIASSIPAILLSHTAPAGWLCGLYDRTSSEGWAGLQWELCVSRNNDSLCGQLTMKSCQGLVWSLLWRLFSFLRIGIFWCHRITGPCQYEQIASKGVYPINAFR